MISMIFSGLALLAAAVCLYCTMNEKKRSKERRVAVLRYVDEADKALAERIEKLEKGITPDYEQAKAAAKAVNDFSAGVSNILGFDPYEALQVSRQKELGDIE